MRNLVYKLGILALILSVILTGCAQQSEPQKAVETTVAVDGLGRSVQIPAKVERAISLAPNLTETLFAIGAGDRLVGVTTYCNYPEAALAVEKVGDTMTPNIERIIALKPQLVLVSTASQLESFMRTLDERGIAVFVAAPTDIKGVAKDMRTLGKIFGVSESAETAVRSFEERIAKVATEHNDKKPVSVFLQVSNEPLFTIGKESFLNEVIETAGGISVTKDVATAYPKISKETAAAMAPDVIILSESDDNSEPNAALKNSPAVKNGRVYKINADIISRPGPRTAEALERIADLLSKQN